LLLHLIFRKKKRKNSIISKKHTHTRAVSAIAQK